MAYEYTSIRTILGEEIPYQLAWDPSILTTGINPIGNGWSSRTARQWGTSSIQDIVSPLGSKIWRRSLTTGDSAFCASVWSALPQAEEKIEVLTLQRRSGSVDYGMGNISRMNLSGNVQGYFWGFRNNQTELRGRRWVNGVEITTATFFHSFGNPADRWFWIRSQSFDNVHKLRVWEYGTAEPVTWQIEYTDVHADASLLTSGYVGEGDFTAGGMTSDIAFVSAGFRGAPAPMSLSEIPLQIFVSAVESDGARYSMTGSLSDRGDIYAVATLPYSGIPTYEQIIAGNNASGTAARGTGSQADITAFNFYIEGVDLADNPSHQLHAVARRLITS